LLVGCFDMPSVFKGVDDYFHTLYIVPG
jgi:hypothetical protein